MEARVTIRDDGDAFEREQVASVTWRLVRYMEGFGRASIYIGSSREGESASAGAGPSA